MDAGPDPPHFAAPIAFATGLSSFILEIMILIDQPTIFSSKVTVRVSNVDDGTMSFRSLPDDHHRVRENRENFIVANGGETATTALVYVTYGHARTYDEYKLAEAVNSGLLSGVDDVADGLATSSVSQGLFLPVADCCPAILYDVKHHAIMLSHLGRHSVEKFGVTASLEFMKAQFATQPRDVLAWLGPAVGSETYPIFARGNQSLKELITTDLKASGVPSRNIEISAVDTAKNVQYFSHSEYQKGHRASDGRFAVFARMNDLSAA